MAKDRGRLARILADHVDAPYDPEHREFIEIVASALYERYQGFPGWPKSVRFFYACYDLNFQVGNGGFAQAAYNIPHLIPVAQQAFERFGRMKAAALCQTAMSKLPAELAEHLAKGFNGAESLQDVFDHFSESSMAELDEQVPAEFWVDAKLQDLVERNRKDFESIDRMTDVESAAGSGITRRCT
jgi:hypothetical protein